MITEKNIYIKQAGQLSQCTTANSRKATLQFPFLTTRLASSKLKGLDTQFLESNIKFLDQVPKEALPDSFVKLMWLGPKGWLETLLGFLFVVPIGCVDSVALFKPLI